MPDQTPSEPTVRRRRSIPIDPQTPQAAALRYDGEDHAPTVVARGTHQAAEKILELAREYDVPIQRDPTLVSILGALELGTQIPPELYDVIAEVLAWAYYTDKRASEPQRVPRAA